jgi:hypothetical protein
MEAIAAAYESTVRFLSLAYDQMEAWDVNPLKDKGSSAGGDKNEALRLIRSSFLLIASPFVPYQRSLADAERDPMGELATMVAKDVRGVVNFEDAAERFGYLAPFIFPLAEGEDDGVWITLLLLCRCRLTILLAPLLYFSRHQPL